AVLAAGAEKYGFAVARPGLGPLCGHSGDGLGPDIQGLADPFPFHPTGVGSLRMASSVVRLIEPSTQR
ncbi:MAG: GDSL-type esterase/lipase family protein, partial [Actinomycetes bacterium]